MPTKIVALVLAACVLGTAANAEAAKKVKTAAKKTKPTAAELFKKLDLNEDGQLSLGEFIGKRTGEAATKAEEQFAKLDADHNGSISLEEFHLPHKKAKK